MGNIRELYTIPVPSTDFWLDAGLIHYGTTSPTVRYTYKKDGVVYGSGLQFNSVVSFRHRAEPFCNEWHLEAYDTLVEVEDSAWVAELRRDTDRRVCAEHEMHHYMICLESTGCFEFIADSWSVVPEAPYRDAAK